MVCGKGLAQSQAIALTVLTIFILAIAAVAVVLAHRGHRRAATRRVSCFNRKQRDHNRCEKEKKTVYHSGSHNREFALIQAIVTDGA